MADRALPVLRGERVVLRPPEEADLAPLAAILAEPDVARWWGRHDLDRLRDELAEWPLSVVIEAAGEVAGLMLVGEEDDPDYRHAHFDIAVRTADHGTGVAREAMRLLVAHLIEARGHHRLSIDPAAGNERAIRAYAALGFRPVGIMRRYERAPDGTWHDGLLMDLLAGEFVER